MQYPDKSGLAYWIRREADERAKAEDTSCLVRAVHAEMADTYAALIARLTGEERKEA